jgi:O-antigen/teichoic acid export membrane protein
MTGISLGRPTLTLLLTRPVGYMLSLVNSIVIARALGPGRLGAYAYAMGLTGVFSLVPNLGVATVVTRTIARHPDTGGSILRPAIRLQAIMAAGILIGIPAFAAALPRQPVPLLYVGLAAAQLALSSLSWPYLAILGGRGRFDRLAVVETAAAVAGLASTLLGAGMGGGPGTFLALHGFVAGGAVLLARWISLPLLPPAQDPPPGLRALAWQGAPFGATAAAQSLYSRLDLVMLGQLALRDAVGLYSVAYKPINMATHLGGTVAGVLFPVMARHAGPTPPAAFGLAMRGLGVAGPALALGLSGLAEPLLRLLYGAEYAAAAPILIVLAWAAAANWLYAPLATALQATGQERAWLRCVLLATGLNAAGNLVAIPRWGATGAGTATLVSEAFLLAAAVILLRPHIALAAALRPVLIIAGATASAASLLAALALSGAGRLAATAAVCCLYAGFIILAGMIAREDLSLLARWAREAAEGVVKR